MKAKSIAEAVSDVRNAQLAMTEVWLQSHALHDPIGMHEYEDPAAMRFDCARCGVGFKASVITHLDDIAQSEYRVEVVGREFVL